MKLDEEKIQIIIKPYYAIARAGDWEHILRVVKWVKILGDKRNDLHLLIMAAYIHDIGWSGVAPKGKLNLKKMLQLELKANLNSVKLAREVLEKLNFPQLEIAIIHRLVLAADKHKADKDDEAIVVDADNLSKLCVEHIQEKYQPQSFKKMINLLENELAYRITTPKGRELFPKLLADLKIQISNKLK